MEVGGIGRFRAAAVTAVLAVQRNRGLLLPHLLAGGVVGDDQARECDRRERAPSRRHEGGLVNPPARRVGPRVDAARLGVEEIEILELRVGARRDGLAVGGEGYRPDGHSYLLVEVWHVGARERGSFRARFALHGGRACQFLGHVASDFFPVALHVRWQQRQPRPLAGLGEPVTQRHGLLVEQLAHLGNSLLEAGQVRGQDAERVAAPRERGERVLHHTSPRSGVALAERPLQDVGAVQGVYQLVLPEPAHQNHVLKDHGRGRNQRALPGVEEPVGADDEVGYVLEAAGDAARFQQVRQRLRKRQSVHAFRLPLVQRDDERTLAVQEGSHGLRVEEHAVGQHLGLRVHAHRAFDGDLPGGYLPGEQVGDRDGVSCAGFVQRHGEGFSEPVGGCGAEHSLAHDATGVAQRYLHRKRRVDGSAACPYDAHLDRQARAFLHLWEGREFGAPDPLGKHAVDSSLHGGEVGLEESPSSFSVCCHFLLLEQVVDDAFAAGDAYLFPDRHRPHGAQGPQRARQLGVPLVGDGCVVGCEKIGAVAAAPPGQKHLRAGAVGEGRQDFGQFLLERRHLRDDVCAPPVPVGRFCVEGAACLACVVVFEPAG